MNIEIQYVTDKSGNKKFVQIPVEMWERIKTRIDLEDGQDNDVEPFKLEDKDGVFVVKCKPTKDLKNIVTIERRERIAELIDRTGL